MTEGLLDYLQSKLGQAIFAELGIGWKCRADWWQWKNDDAIGGSHQKLP
ncbi:MAG: hypothetical protein ACYYK0_03810 [Candidatus Eutrophobiaceae bacterium]